jgi:26S proteasome regulatory subunit N1
VSRPVVLLRTKLILVVGLQDGSDATIETLKVIEHSIAKQALILVEVCAFANTGNVLRVQGMLHYCGEHLTQEKEEVKDDKKAEGKKTEDKSKSDDTFQAFAVIGIAVIAMGEDIGAEMCLRQFNHLVTCPHFRCLAILLMYTPKMHYGDPIIRQAVPLALGLISASNPQLPIMDTLSKYSHDNDLQVAANAIFAMGLIGAGTNNARLAQMLRQLAGYYAKEPDCLFVVRIAQGLVHMGKGTMTLNPFFWDRGVMSRTAVAGLLATLVAFVDVKSCELSRLLALLSATVLTLFRPSVILDKYHWMLYYLVTAMYPRLMITLDEKLENLPVTVRVGQVCFFLT